MRPAEVSRIADGSSDVCSSDLVGGPQGGIAPAVVKSYCPGTSSQSRRVVDQRLQLEGGQALSTQHPQPAHPGLPRFRLGEQASSFAPARCATTRLAPRRCVRSEEHTSELQSLMRISYAVFCLKKKKHTHYITIECPYATRSAAVRYSMNKKETTTTEHT